jgi:hypothetical protein
MDKQLEKASAWVNDIVTHATESEKKVNKKSNNKKKEIK